MDTPCPICLRPVQQTDKYSTKTYCSRVCSNEAQKRRAYDRKKRSCKNCGVEFAPPAQNDQSQKYCSNECYHKSTTVATIRECPVCSTEFRVVPSEMKDTCSRSCSLKYEPHRLAKKKSLLKTLETTRTKYGVDNVSQIGRTPESLEVLSSRESLLRYLGDRRDITTEGLAQELGVSCYLTYDKLKKFGLWDRISTTGSRYEHEIDQLIKSWGFETEKTRRVIHPYEIDIYIPSKKLGIEFNGDYWHSEVHKTQNYHQKKSLLAREQGVQLFHIFEYEWRDERKRQAIVGQLQNLLGVGIESVFARSTKVVELDSKSKSDFLLENHRQGNDNASVRLGLEHNGRLVAVMTFGRARFSQKYEWELSRFCSLRGVRVVGGASKLFKYFVKTHNPGSIVSYADIAKTRGELYERLGFTLSHISSPNYVWTDLLQVLTRYQTQMKNERQTMQDAGFFRVFDCGSQVWTWST